MAHHYLPEHHRRVTDDCRRHGRVPDPLRVREHNSESSPSLPAPARPPVNALVPHTNVASAQVHLPIIMEERDLNPFEPIPIEYLRAFKDMWTDGGVQQAVERGNEYALQDNLS